MGGDRRVCGEWVGPSMCVCVFVCVRALLGRRCAFTCAQLALGFQVCVCAVSVWHCVCTLFVGLR